jgi:hypothetical protein
VLAEVIAKCSKMAAEYCGVKCGLKFNPPTLVVFYKQTGKSEEFKVLFKNGVSTSQ